MTLNIPDDKLFDALCDLLNGGDIAVFVDAVGYAPKEGESIESAALNALVQFIDLATLPF